MTINVDNMRKFAETLSERNEIFEKDLFTFGTQLLTPENKELMTYSVKGQEPIFYPNIGVIGLLGIQNTWSNPLETCLRYYLLNNSINELPIVEQILDNLYDRIQAGKDMKEKNMLDEKALHSLSLMDKKLAILVAGIGLVKDMIKKQSSLTSNLDGNNLVAENWCGVYS